MFKALKTCLFTTILLLALTASASADICDQLTSRAFEEALAEAYNERTGQVDLARLMRNLGYRDSGSPRDAGTTALLETTANRYERYRTVDTAEDIVMGPRRRISTERRELDDFYLHALRTPGTDINEVERFYQQRLDELSDRLATTLEAGQNRVDTVMTPDQIRPVETIIGGGGGVRIDDAIARLGVERTRLTRSIEAFRQEMRNRFHCPDDNDGGGGPSGSASPIGSCAPARNPIADFNRTAIPAQVRDVLTRAPETTLDLVNRNRRQAGEPEITQEDLDRIQERYESDPRSLEGMGHMHGISLSPALPGPATAAPALESIGAGALPRVLAWLRNFLPAAEGFGTAGAFGGLPSTPGGSGLPGLPAPAPSTPGSSRPTPSRTRPRANKPTADAGCRFVGSATLTRSSNASTPIAIEGGNLTFISKCYSEREEVTPDDLTALVTARQISATREGTGELNPTMKLTVNNAVTALTFASASRPSASASRRGIAKIASISPPAPPTPPSEGIYKAFPLTANWIVDTVFEPSSSETTDMSRQMLNTVRDYPARTEMKVTRSFTVTSPYAAPVQLHKYPC